MVGAKKKFDKVRGGLLLGGMLIVLLLVSGVGFQTFGVGSDFSVYAAMEELKYGEDYWTPGVEYPGVVDFYGVDMVIADFDATPAGILSLENDKAEFGASVFCTGSINSQGIEGFDIIPYEEVLIDAETVRKSYKLIFEAQFFVEPELTGFGDLNALSWTATYAEGDATVDLIAGGFDGYMPAGGVTTSIGWLFSMTKIEADLGSKILSADAGLILTSNYYVGAGIGTFLMGGVDSVKSVLSNVYPNYAFNLGSASLETLQSAPIVSESEVDIRMYWDVSLDPMILHDGEKWISVATTLIQKFYVDVTVMSAETVVTAEDPAPPIISGPETFGMMAGEAVNVIFSASSLNPATYSIYEQDYFEDQEFNLDISESTFWSSGVWDGGDIGVDMSSLVAGRYAVTVVVEDSMGVIEQHTTFLIVTSVDAEHVSDGYDVSARTAPTGDNVADNVVSGYIPRPRDSIIDTLMDNKILLGGVVVGVVVVGGIGFTVLIKKPKKKRMKKKKKK